MNFRTIIILSIAIFIFGKTFAQSEAYQKKKENALKTVSPFELIATHQKTDQVLEYEDDELMVFESLNKQAPVHLLIVPKKRINTLNETDAKHQQMLGKMILLAKEMAKKKGIDETGYRLTLNTNEDAGQSVFHIHLHLLGGTKLGPIVEQTWREQQKEGASVNTEKALIDEKKAIENLMQTFMKCIINKDSTTFYSLFHTDPVTWVGISKEKSWQEDLKSNSKAKDFFKSTYRNFFKSLLKPKKFEEKFYNTEIVNDREVASATFDYSFWVNDKKQNWGKESWGLIKTDGKWKITSVIFSFEYESVQPELVNSDNQKEVKSSKIESYINQFKDTTNFHGTVLIAKGDSIIHHAAYGYFDIERKILNKTNTQFLIGSLTKSVVASAVMQLVDEGKLSLTTPIKQYLPELEDRIAKGVTLHHLLKQQSGLDQYIEDLTEIEVMDITSAELITLINKAKRAFEPGKKHAYSNLNYNLLAIILERVTGLSYPNYMQQKIFKPLGLQQTGMERLSNIPANRAIGYRTVNGIFRPIQNVTSYAMGTGDIYATAQDIFKWGQALQKGLLVKEENKKKMFDGGPKDWGYYGYGFRIQPYQRASEIKETGTLIRHGGTMNGFVSNYHYYKEDDLTVIVLSNNRDVPIRKITYNLKEIALGLQPNQRKNIMLE
jgi:CubicO group peptidase (beta-lactamase class C family)/diadenosine tetraphosphate (Ap4A) HIT family hydrolase